MTPFDRDVHAALERAQKETLARGEYGFTYKLMREPADPRASSIDEARELSAEDGTCSVLDVYELGPKPAPGIAGPLTIGPTKPTKDDIEAALPDLYEALGRGEAGYLVCYESGKPASIWFIGMSFD